MTGAAASWLPLPTPADASAARMSPRLPVAPDAEGRRRVLYAAAILTGYAPGCAELPLSDPRRHGEFWVKRPEQIVRSLLFRLRRAPRDVRVDALGPDELIIAARMPIDGDPRPILAFLIGGLDLADFQHAVEALRAESWRPQALPFSTDLARSAAA